MQENTDIQSKSQESPKALDCEPASLPEDEQIAIAIANSLRETACPDNDDYVDDEPDNSNLNIEDSNDSPIGDLKLSDNLNEDNNYKNFLGPNTG